MSCEQENSGGRSDQPTQPGQEAEQETGPDLAPDQVADSALGWFHIRPTGQTVDSRADGTPEGQIWANYRYVVIVRRCGSSPFLGEMVWLSIRRQDRKAIHDWRELQWLKNEIVGDEAEAVELYPAESRKVDAANQYHLWCFPTFRFPFGFGERLVTEDTVEAQEIARTPLRETAQGETKNTDNKGRDGSMRQRPKSQSPQVRQQKPWASDKNEGASGALRKERDQNDVF